MLLVSGCQMQQSRTSSHVGGNELSEQVDKVYYSIYSCAESTERAECAECRCQKSKLFGENINNLAAAWFCSGELPQYRHTNWR